MLDPLPLKMLVEYIKFFLNTETFCALRGLGYQPPPLFLAKPAFKSANCPLYIGFS